MKRYLVFAMEAYYPAGGWGDFKQAFETSEEAIGFADSIVDKYSGCVEVIDLHILADIYVYPIDRIVSDAR